MDSSVSYFDNYYRFNRFYWIGRFSCTIIKDIILSLFSFILSFTDGLFYNEIKETNLNYKKKLD